MNLRHEVEASDAAFDAAGVRTAARAVSDEAIQDHEDQARGRDRPDRGPLDPYAAFEADPGTLRRIQVKKVSYYILVFANFKFWA